MGMHCRQWWGGGKGGMHQLGCVDILNCWQSPLGCCRKNERPRELLTAHTLDDRFLSEMKKVKQHSAVMKRSKRAALNYHFSQCSRDWLGAQCKITSELSHAEPEQLREKCWGGQGLSQQNCCFHLILKAVQDPDPRIRALQREIFLCVLLCEFSAGQRGWSSHVGD